MASSKDKAVGLKDAYVAGLLDSAGPEGAAEAGAGAIAELAGKLGMEQGQQASAHIDLDRNTYTPANDGDPHNYATRNGVTTRAYAPEQAYPLKGYGHGTQTTIPLTGGLRYETQQNMRNGFYR